MLLLCPDVIGAHMDYNVTGLTKVASAELLEGIISFWAPEFCGVVGGEESLWIYEFPI